MSSGVGSRPTRQSAPPQAPVVSTATRTACCAAPVRIAAGGERVPGELEPPRARLPGPEPSVPSVRTASATCAATSSATARSSAPKSSPTRTSSTEPTIGRRLERAGASVPDARTRSAARRVASGISPAATASQVGASAGDLRAERRALRSERARDELPVGIEDAHDREVGAGCLRRRASEGSERGAQIVARGDLGRGPRERISTGSRWASTTIVRGILPDTRGRLS